MISSTSARLCACSYTVCLILSFGLPVCYCRGDVVPLNETAHSTDTTTQHQGHDMKKPPAAGNQMPAASKHGPGEMHAAHMQHAGMGMGFYNIPHTREASGTSWQPDSSPVHAEMKMLGPWHAMLHYNLALNYDHQDGPRGANQINSMNWAMLMASRPIGPGKLTLRTMLTLEPLTDTPRGYPLLFQTGESYGGKPLVDRQHPHDFFMEIASRYQHPLGADTSLSLYGAISGEPALGPPAFMHRVSAMDLPMSPLSHHWQDSTHISFGVLTAGIARGNLQVEGSAFNGREPDEHRWNIDPIKIDAYSGRVSYNPGSNWSLQASHGYLRSPESLHPGESVHRTTVSLSHNLPRADNGNWATSLVWGRNRIMGDDSNSFLLESNLNLANKNTVFGRLEWVEKSGEELDLVPAAAKHPITVLTVGGVHELTPGRSYQTGVGAAFTINWKPKDLDPLYGKDPWAAWLFVRIRHAPG